MGLMKKLTSAIVASSLVLSLVGTAAAAYTPAAGETAGKRMQDLKILMGKPGVGLDLNGEITRAELVTVIVRAFGKEADAQLLKGSTAFPDIANHWASGNIAMAKALVEKAGSDAIGMPDGTFAPDAKLTAAQAVAFLMKFVGVKADASKTWPANYLDVAVEKNIITAEDKALIAPQLNENATRGLTFYLFDRAFYGYNLPTGKTFYTQYVDTMGPEVTLNAIDATTIDSKVTVTGNVKDAVSVFVGTTAVTPDASGNFSANYDLPELKDYTITVTARDLAGNTTEKSAKVTRAAGTAAAIEAADVTVAAGGTVEVKAVVKDAKGNVLATPVTGTATVGTYADGKYTAGAAVGTATVTLKAGEVSKDVKVTVVAGALAKVEASAASVAPGKAVTLVAKDAAGNTITGATFSQTSADALLDATTGTFIATKAGVYPVKATKDGVTVEGTVGVYGAVAKLVVNAPASIVANGETEVDVLVNAVDEKGNIVLGYEGDMKLVAFGTTYTETADNGVATFTITAPATYGDSEVDLTATYDTDLTKAGFDASKNYTGSIMAEAQVATSIKVEADEYLTSDIDAGTGDLTEGAYVITVLDQKGEDMVDGAWQVDVTVTGDATLELGDVTKTDTFTVTAGATNSFPIYALEKGDEGSVTVTAAFTGLTSGQDSMKVAMPKDPTSLVLTVKDSKTEVIADATTKTDADDTISKATYTVKVVDKNGVPTKLDGNVEISLDGVDRPQDLYVADNAALDNWTAVGADNDTFVVTTVDGVATFALVGQHVDSFTLVATDDEDDDYDLKDSAQLSLSVKAGPAAQVGLTKSTLNYLKTENASATVSAQLFDAFGNKVAAQGLEITFTTADYDGVTINGTDDDVTVETDANGVATAKIAIANYVTGNVSVGIETDEDLDISAGTLTVGTKGYASVTLVSALTMPTSVTVETIKTTGEKATTFASGTTFKVRATVKDNYGRAVDDADVNFLTNFGLSLTTSNADLDVSGVTFATTGTSGVYESTAFAAEKAETLTLTVKVGKIADTVQGTKAVSIKAGDVNKAVVAEATSTGLDVTAGKESDLFTIQLADAEKNLTNTLQNTTGYKVALSGADRFENSTGTEITSVQIDAGKTSAKFRLYAADLAVSTKITLTVYGYDPVAKTYTVLLGTNDITLK